MGHFFSKVSLFIDKKEAAAHLILDQDFATAPKDEYVYSVTFKMGVNLDNETEYAATNVSISDNSLSFECGGYSIAITLSNNEYKLTIESDSGKSDSTILTRE